jgi:2-polyprenyl-3-methyl-5-hydroxy-6-metoxy-1,4-benzoquinol methylase
VEFETILEKGDHALARSLDQLLESGLVSCTGIKYSLTKRGVAQVKQFMSGGYSALLVTGEQSATSRKFCEQVYGLNLCQFNSMSMIQLHKLLEVMNLGEEDHILDLGCGAGLISEYISDLTGASVVGIDLPPGPLNEPMKGHARNGDGFRTR